MLKLNHTPRILALTLTGGFLMGGAVFGGLGASGRLWAKGTDLQQQDPGAAAVAPDRGQGAARSMAPVPADLSEQFTRVYVDLAQQVTPAVVRIEVRRPGSSSGWQSGPDIPEPFREFFNLPQGSPNPQAPPPEQMAGGSGFLISPDGYILTNAHVVESADRIVVRLRDRTSHTAEVVGTDPTTDLAVIKIDGHGLPTLPFGSSENVQVGEPVMAVGNPGFAGAGSLDYTVTTGIVSALGRPLPIIRESLNSNPDLAGYAIENFVQTDAVINPGNSGGPLVDLQGRVVGVNSAIASSDGYYQGYGFAIPADLANRVSHDLMANGRVIRAWMGVSVTGVTSEDAEVYRLPVVEGVLVQSVTEKSPAEKAGVKAEDVIVAVNGRPVEDGGDLQERIAELAPGQRAELEIYRQGRQQTLTVKLGEAPLESAGPAAAAPEKATAEALLGLQVQDMTPQMAREIGWSRAGGAVITDVIPWSPANEKGLLPGMRVMEVDHTPVTDAKTFHQAISGLKPGQVVSLRLTTPDGTDRIVNLRAEEG